MKERPLIMTGRSVRQLLAGSKTQSRRVVKDPPKWWGTWNDGAREQPTGYTCIKPSADGLFIQGIGGVASPAKPSPYGVPGDRLWVREAWGARSYTDTTDWYRGSLKGATTLPPHLMVDYRADWGSNQEACFWRPSLLMPRWASRITLEVTDVRVQRLQDISREDALAEGVPAVEPGDPPEWPVRMFQGLWDTINGAKAPWSSNPWLWCLTFKRVEAK